MTKVPDFTPEKWEKWLKDKAYAEERVEHLEDELDKALDGERLSVVVFYDIYYEETIKRRLEKMVP